MSVAGDMPNEVYQRLRSHLAYLKLTAVAEALPAQLEAARAEDMSHTVLLERLLGIEAPRPPPAGTRPGCSWPACPHRGGWPTSTSTPNPNSTAG